MFTQGRQCAALCNGTHLALPGSSQAGADEAADGTDSDNSDPHDKGVKPVDLMVGPQKS